MPTRTPTSVVIPTYNGYSLLKKHLPLVEKLINTHDELIIIDDASQDRSVDFLIKRYHLHQEENFSDQYGQAKFYLGSLDHRTTIKLVVNQFNLRFAASCNRAVKQCQHKLVLLINNDVAPAKNLLDVLTTDFSKNNKLFAIGCKESEPSLKASGGKNKLWFEKGIFQHSRAKKFISGETAWASGGSMIFDRQKWLELNGFDTDYYPAYWEDIDLSARAKKKGWQVKFNEKAAVTHNHESTNKSVFGQQALETISWQHTHLFVRKHGTNKQKLQNILWRPYWAYQRLKTNYKKPNIWGPLLLLLIAGILRFYKLAQVPHGMTWDEAAIGYNGYAVVHTRRDEWLQRLPVSFMSFGDYKAPLAIYLNGVFTTILGLNLYAVRLPFVVSGILAVWGLVKLVKQIFSTYQLKTSLDPTYLSLAAGFLLACSPWHLHFTRTGFESGLALTMIIWGAYYWFRFIEKAHVSRFLTNLKNILPMIICWTAALYTYHSAKIFLPFLILFLLGSQFRKIKLSWREIGIAGLLGGLGLFPLIKDSIQGEGLTRAGTLIITRGFSLTEVLSMITTRLVVHLSPKFLIGGYTDNLRHGPGAWSLFLPVTYLFICLGVVNIVYCLAKRHSAKGHFLAIAWVGLGLMPAILGMEYPQSNRALLALPGFIWLAIIGLNWFIAVIRRYKFNLNMFLLGLMSVYLLSIGLYLRYYYQVYAKTSADDYLDGYIEAMQLTHNYEKGTNGYPEVNKIVFTNDYGQAYIYALFVRKTNPIWYRGGSLIKYLFVDDINIGSLTEENALIVASQSDDIPLEKADHLVYGSDGQVRFKIYYTGQKR